MKHAQARDFYRAPRWSPTGWTASCAGDTTKIDALVFFLDFEIYRQTGRSVTQAQYVAAALRPVTPLPRQLYRADVALPFRCYDRATFTRRELRLMHQLGQAFAGVTGADMPDASPVKTAVVWHATARGPTRRDAGASLAKALDADIAAWVALIPGVRVFDLR